MADEYEVITIDSSSEEENEVKVKVQYLSPMNQPVINETNALVSVERNNSSNSGITNEISTLQDDRESQHLILYQKDVLATTDEIPVIEQKLVKTSSKGTKRIRSTSTKNVLAITDEIPVIEQKLVKTSSKGTKRIRSTSTKTMTADPVIEKSKSLKKRKTSKHTTLDKQRLYCFCKKPYDGRRFYIYCDQCEDWFHGKCVGVLPSQADSITIYCCPDCQKKNEKEVKERHEGEVNKSAEIKDSQDTRDNVIQRPLNKLLSNESPSTTIDVVSSLQSHDYCKVIIKPIDDKIQYNKLNSQDVTEIRGSASTSLCDTLVDDAVPKKFDVKKNTLNSKQSVLYSSSRLYCARPMISINRLKFSKFGLVQLNGYPSRIIEAMKKAPTERSMMNMPSDSRKEASVVEETFSILDELFSDKESTLYFPPHNNCYPDRPDKNDVNLGKENDPDKNITEEEFYEMVDFLNKNPKFIEDFPFDDYFPFEDSFPFEDFPFEEFPFEDFHFEDALEKGQQPEEKIADEFFASLNLLPTSDQAPMTPILPETSLEVRSQNVANSAAVTSAIPTLGNEIVCPPIQNMAVPTIPEKTKIQLMQSSNSQLQVRGLKPGQLISLADGNTPLLTWPTVQRSEQPNIQKVMFVPAVSVVRPTPTSFAMAKTLVDATAGRSILELQKGHTTEVRFETEAERNIVKHHSISSHNENEWMQPQIQVKPEKDSHLHVEKIKSENAVPAGETFAFESGNISSSITRPCSEETRFR